MNKSRITGRIFLVGCPRSGTTLLQSLLAAHSEVASFPESHFFWNLLPDNPKLGASGIARPGANERLRKFLQKTAYQGLDIGLPTNDHLISGCARTFAEVMDTLTLNDGKRIWLEKTPQHLHRVDVIEEYVPSPAFIQIVRNGIDVVASLFDVTNKYPEE